MEQSFTRILLSTLLLVSISLLARLFNSLILKPQRIRSKFQKQGINGPPPSFLLGNISELMKINRKRSMKLVDDGEREINHNYSSALFPFYNQWREQYGSTFNFSVANMQILLTNNPDVVKEISKRTSFDLERSSLQHIWLDPLLGQGIVNSTGQIWAHQRKIIAPQFYLDNVKGMMKLMVDSALTLVNTWISKIESEGGISDIQVDGYMRSFSADVISGACFGSNYSEGIEIFSKITALEETLSKNIFLNGIPKIRYLLPTKSNREGWKLAKEIQTLILKIVEKRKRETPDEKGILQRILEGAKGNELGKDEYSTDRFIVDNCKNLCLAGFESSAMTATWTLMLLALNPEWLNRVRVEIVEVCKGELPDADMLPKMKTLTMVINETLRLYPPVSAVFREAFNEIKLGDIIVPKGVNVLILITILHQHPNFWGHDAGKFNPERFANGIGGACKHPHVYIPFGIGPHTCLGQYFAIAELKILLSLIVSNFTFSISPKYRHSPVLNMVVQPQHGLNLLVKRL